MLLTIDRRVPRGHLSKPTFSKERRRRRRTPVLLNPPLNTDEQRVARAIEGGVKSARDAVKSARLREAIRMRNPDEIVASVPLEPLRGIMRPIETVYRDQVVRSGNRAFSGLNSNLRFAVTDKVVIDAAAKRAGALVQNITDTQLRSLRGAIVDAVAGQFDAEDTASIIRSSIGLTDRYAGAVASNYKLVKDAGLQAGLSVRAASDAAEKSAMRYSDRLLRSRARTIAQTEIHQMQNIGKQQAWSDLISDGTMLPDAMKVWRANFGACDICMGFNGETVPVVQPFSNGNEQPEAHPNCRCTADLESDEEYAARTGIALEEPPAAPRAEAPTAPARTQPKGAGRPGMGDLALDDALVAEFQGGSAQRYLVTGDDGIVRFTPERAALHDRYIEDALVGLERSERPTVYMLGGGPASGKSTMLLSGKVDIPVARAATVNPDDARAFLPEYKKGIEVGDKGISTFTHAEASYVSKRLTQAAIERNLDVVIDGTGDGSAASLAKKVAAAKRAGYEVKGYYATVPTRTAIDRSNARAMKPGPDFGRFVPEEVIIETHKGVSRVFPQAAKEIYDEVVLFDTTTGTPQLIASAVKGRLTISDAAAYQRFLDKADEVFDNPLGARLPPLPLTLKQGPSGRPLAATADDRRAVIERGYEPKAYVELGEDVRQAHLIDEYINHLDDLAPQLANVARKRISAGGSLLNLSTAEHAIAKTGTIFANGPVTVTVTKAARLSKDDRQFVFDTIDDLMAQNPKRAIQVIIGPTGEGRTAGKAVPSGRRIVIAPKTIRRKKKMAPSEVREWNGEMTFMPSVFDIRWGRYVLAHEWGHVLDAKVTDPAGIQRRKGFHALATPENMSYYGRSNEFETMAEAHAEWFNTKGRSKNKLVQQIAETMGWKWKG